MINLLRALRTGDPLPNQVSLDPYSSTWFDSLWRLSLIPSGGEQVREHGAALVEAKDGSLTVATARPGSSDTFNLDERELELEEFRGYFHTHPYEERTTGVAFSRGDFLATILHQMEICMAQSGDDLFLLVRTPATPAQVPNKILTEFDKMLDYYYRAQGEAWQDAVLLTNQHICREFGLAFYVGKMRQPLQRMV